MKSYAGIGSREITVDERNTIYRISSYLFTKRYFLYSGGADGSDYAFEYACRGYGLKFLPWDGFNHKPESNIYSHVIHSAESFESIQKYHPAPDLLSPAAKKLMSRNYFQINGFGSFPKVDFVICCADPIRNSRAVKGGTGQAVRIALDLDIPVFNIRERGCRWESFLNHLPVADSSSRAEIENNLRQN
jgi:hypothetical protein